MDNKRLALESYYSIGKKVFSSLLKVLYSESFLRAHGFGLN